MFNWTSCRRGRTVSPAPKGRWEEREILETTDLPEFVEKTDPRASKARWVFKETSAHLVLLGRRFVAAVTQTFQNDKLYHSEILLTYKVYSLVFFF